MSGTSLREELRRSRRRRAVSLMPLTKLRRPNALPHGHIINTGAELRWRDGRPEATVLLSVDQLEEALLLSARHFPAADHRLLVVATLRADFTGTLQRHAALREPAAEGDKILATRLFKGPLRRAAFHAIIEGPAALSGLELEPGLASRIVDEARTDDALPLLALALRELWDRYGKKDL